MADYALKHLPLKMKEGVITFLDNLLNKSHCNGDVKFGSAEMLRILVDELNNYLCQFGEVSTESTSKFPDYVKKYWTRNNNNDENRAGSKSDFEKHKNEQMEKEILMSMFI
jgi:hypothetical protein